MASKPADDRTTPPFGGAVVHLRLHRHQVYADMTGLEVITEGDPEPTRDEVIKILRRALRMYGATP